MVSLPGLSRAEPKPRLTTDRIVDAAIGLLRRDGYDALSMRSLARELDTGPASLYQHVRNKDELDQLLLDRVARDLDLPEPEPDRWAEQLKAVLRQTRDLYRAHRGSARAAFGQVPSQEGTVRAAEGMMAIMVAGGVSPQAAAWFLDQASLYVAAIAYEESVWAQRENSTRAGDDPDHEAIDAQLLEVWQRLPAAQFPMLATYGAEMTAGDGDERFEFGIDLLVAGLAAVSDRYR